MYKLRHNAWGDGSDKINSPGQSNFMRSAVHCVLEMKGQQDGDGLKFSRKSIIRTALALNTIGLREMLQQKPPL